MRVSYSRKPPSENLIRFFLGAHSAVRNCSVIIDFPGPIAKPPVRVGIEGRPLPETPRGSGTADSEIHTGATTGPAPRRDGRTTPGPIAASTAAPVEPVRRGNRRQLLLRTSQRRA